MQNVWKKSSNFLTLGQIGTKSFHNFLHTKITTRLWYDWRGDFHQECMFSLLIFIFVVFNTKKVWLSTFSRSLPLAPKSWESDEILCITRVPKSSEAVPSSFKSLTDVFQGRNWAFEGRRNFSFQKRISRRRFTWPSEENTGEKVFLSIINVGLPWEPRKNHSRPFQRLKFKTKHQYDEISI